MKKICVFSAGTAQDKFYTNGERILSFTKCRETKEFNGKWEIEFEHPLDEDGDWQFLKGFNILKVPVRMRDASSMKTIIKEQLFEIYYAEVKMSESGKGYVTGRAQHIFYVLNGRILVDKRPRSKTGAKALEYIMTNYDRAFSYGFNYDFTYSSNISTINTAYYEGKSITAALLAEDNAFVNRWGGELYRDNFYFSVNAKKENSLEGIFEIKYGFDMKAIGVTTDYSGFTNYLIAKNDRGHIYRIHTDKNNTFPRLVAEYKYFGSEDPEASDSSAKQELKKNAEAYFKTVSHPAINYTIAYAKLTDTELYKDFINLQEREVGDTGMVINEVLGIKTTQKVTKKITDVLTDTVESIELGNLKGTITRTINPTNIINAETSQQQSLIADSFSFSIKCYGSYTLPVLSDCTGSYSIDWGDGGTFESIILNTSHIHTYSEPGTYTITIYIDDSFTGFVQSAFSSCSELTSFSFPALAADIPGYMFTRCTRLKEVSLSSQTLTIGTGAFMGCASLKEINLTENITSIGERVFYNCDALERIIYDNLSTNFESIRPVNLCSHEVEVECFDLIFTTE
ncbi:leucine-rich repeat protein [Porcipelethomonas sp.]|uniref:leucine-rich repeat protein n=1 Tax=Porcipelethomonas sp. TaxID=2981675 RepID=UPI003EF1D2B2